MVLLALRVSKMPSAAAQLMIDKYFSWLVCMVQFGHLVTQDGLVLQLVCSACSVTV